MHLQLQEANDKQKTYLPQWFSVYGRPVCSFWPWRSGCCLYLYFNSVARYRQAPCNVATLSAVQPAAAAAAFVDCDSIRESVSKLSLSDACCRLVLVLNIAPMTDRRMCAITGAQLRYYPWHFGTVQWHPFPDLSQTNEHYATAAYDVRQ